MIDMRDSNSTLNLRRMQSNSSLKQRRNLKTLLKKWRRVVGHELCRNIAFDCDVFVHGSPLPMRDRIPTKTACTINILPSYTYTGVRLLATTVCLD